MKNFDLSDEEYIVKNNEDGALNGVSGEFTITNENIIFTSEKGKTEIVKKIPLSSIRNPKGHLQALLNKDEERIDLFCNDGLYEIEFDDFDYKKFIGLLQENINGSVDSMNDGDNNDSGVENTVDNLKKGFDTFVGIAKNVSKASTNYIKDASEKYLQKSENGLLDNQTFKEKVRIERVDDIDELKKKLTTLKEMLDEGLLTHDEFEEKRNAIIGKEKKNETPINKVLDMVKDKHKVKKCPSCGELLGTYDMVCPSCGYEIRNVENSNAMEKFQEELNNYEKKRNQANEVNIFGFKLNRENTDIETSKAEFIRNYVVPRTKEDLLEFMILAKSNIEPKLYTRVMFAKFHGCSSQTEYEQRKKLSDAWFSMMQQIFDKTKILFDDEDKTYKKIENMYVDIYNQIM